MENAIIYIHGKYGTAEEAEHYKKFFNEADIIGFKYTSEYPWDFQKEFSNFIDNIYTKYKKISIIANSIGAYFTMLSLTNKNIEKAFFISPIVDMEKLITDMMFLENITEKELYKKKEIKKELKQLVYRILLNDKNNEEVENIFIDYIVYYSDNKEDPVLNIINSYWEKN